MHKVMDVPYDLIAQPVDASAFFPDDVGALLEDPGGSDVSSSGVRLSGGSVVLRKLIVSRHFRVVAPCITVKCLLRSIWRLSDSICSAGLWVLRDEPVDALSQITLRDAGGLQKELGYFFGHRILCMVPVLRVVAPEYFEEVGHLVPALVTHIWSESELFGLSIGRDVCVLKTVKNDG
jgi:hypothetical protein